MATKAGKLFKKLEVQSGTGKASGKPWAKITFVLDLTKDPKYPSYCAFDSFKGNVIEFIQDTSIGTKVAVDYEPESREWQGRWFTTAMASGVEIVRDEEYNSNGGSQNGVDQANQMYGQNNNQNPFEPQEEDLPF